MEQPRFELTASPHIKGPDSTPKIMWSVVGSLAPVVAAALYYFGLEYGYGDLMCEYSGYGYMAIDALSFLVDFAGDSGEEEAA